MELLGQIMAAMVKISAEVVIEQAEHIGHISIAVMIKRQRPIGMG